MKLNVHTQRMKVIFLMTLDFYFKFLTKFFDHSTKFSFINIHNLHITKKMVLLRISDEKHNFNSLCVICYDNVCIRKYSEIYQQEELNSIMSVIN